MKQQEYITSRQFMILVFCYTVGNTILDEPSYVIAWAFRDGWISAISGIAGAIVLVWLYTTLMRRCPGMTLVESMEYLLGKWIGKGVGLFYCVLLLVLFVFSLSFLGTFVTDNLLPRTNRQLLDIIFVLIAVFSVRLGLANIARVSELVFPSITSVLLIMCFLALPRADMGLIKPILENGALPAVQGWFDLMGSVFESVALLMTYPLIRNQRGGVKAFYAGMIGSGIIFSMITILSITVLGSMQSGNSRYGTYLIAANIDIGGISNRIEVIFAISWLIVNIIYAILILYSISMALAQILKLRIYVPVVLPVALIGYAFLPSILANPADYALDAYPLYTGTFGVAIPLILLIASFVRGKPPPKKGEGEWGNTCEGK